MGSHASTPSKATPHIHTQKREVTRFSHDECDQKHQRGAIVPAATLKKPPRKPRTTSNKNTKKRHTHKTPPCAGGARMPDPKPPTATARAPATKPYNQRKNLH
mmetsp:Transcript_34269/g.86677  ORF Transcript_34269/g.86677 Transcript_34269/m.86677 type:complete len:103 (+) Transcript_34269:773-1081(+)